MPRRCYGRHWGWREPIWAGLYHLRFLLPQSNFLTGDVRFMAKSLAMGWLSAISIRCLEASAANLANTDFGNIATATYWPSFVLILDASPSSFVISVCTMSVVSTICTCVDNEVGWLVRNWCYNCANNDKAIRWGEVFCVRRNFVLTALCFMATSFKIVVLLILVRVFARKWYFAVCLIINKHFYIVLIGNSSIHI